MPVDIELLRQSYSEGYQGNGLTFVRQGDSDDYDLTIDGTVSAHTAADILVIKLVNGNFVKIPFSSITATAAEVAAGTDSLKFITPATLASFKAYDTIWVPAAALVPRTTNGAGIGSHEYTTNDIMKDYLAYDSTTEEFADFNLPMPEAWDRGTIKAKFFWSSATSSTANDTVEWQLAGTALSDSDPIDAAYTDAGEVISDVLLADNGTDMQITAATPAITINGTPALGDLIQFTCSRNVGGDDDMLEDAWLFGVLIQIKLTNTVAAW